MAVAMGKGGKGRGEMGLGFDGCCKEKAGMKSKVGKVREREGRNTARFCYLLKREGGGGSV